MALRFSGSCPKSARQLTCVPLSAHPCARSGIGAIHRAAPSGIAAAAAAMQRGPRAARSCAQKQSNAVQGWTDRECFAPFAVPSIAAGSGSKARMSEHTEVRVRAGPLSARSTGHSDSRTRIRTPRSGPTRFWLLFARAKSNPGGAAARKLVLRNQRVDWRHDFRPIPGHPISAIHRAKGATCRR